MDFQLNFLNLRGPVVKFECDATRNMFNVNLKYSLLNILVNNTQILLTPKTFTDLDNRNEQFGLSIYTNGTKGFTTGFMINDQKCFNQMFNSFRRVQTNPTTIFTVGTLLERNSDLNYWRN